MNRRAPRRRDEQRGDRRRDSHERDRDRDRVLDDECGDERAGRGEEPEHAEDPQDASPVRLDGDEAAAPERVHVAPDEGADPAGDRAPVLRQATDAVARMPRAEQRLEQRTVAPGQGCRVDDLDRDGRPLAAGRLGDEPDAAADGEVEERGRDGPSFALDEDRVADDGRVAARTVLDDERARQAPLADAGRDREREHDEADESERGEDPQHGASLGIAGRTAAGSRRHRAVEPRRPSAGSTRMGG
ncbi:hypothetical protein ACDF64_07595 [Agromyces sp. MMS24-JH15]|uniref:hypothetical protein n=1 Tax=Agromyces sp. MMS24-JH15 TaxID=3243765 RepID=UPI00374A0836